MEISHFKPEFFLFLLIPIAIAWLVLKRKQQAVTLKISSIKDLNLQNLISKVKALFECLDWLR
jgi:Ca-activated chloride channel family protein